MDVLLDTGCLVVGRLPIVLFEQLFCIYRSQLTVAAFSDILDPLPPKDASIKSKLTRK